MGKSLLVAIIVGVVLGGVSAGAYFWLKKSQHGAPAVGGNEEQSQAKLLHWKDPAGFTFQYPEGVTIDTHDEDKEHYAHVEMTSPLHPGKVTVWAKDAVAVDVEAWVKTERSFRDASVIDTTLGGQPAKKIFLSSPTKKRIVGTIFDEILWYIEGEPGEGDFWQHTFDTIVTSFTFTPPPGESTDTGASEAVSEETVDEEEVVE